MNWLRTHLVENYRQWWKLHSVKLAAFAGAASFVLTTNQGLAYSLIANIPNGPMRWVFGLIVGLFIFAVPVVTRLWKQNEPPC